MRTSIPISGGLDSTYALWKLLTETSDSIEAVYIDMKDINAQKAAELKTSGFCRNISKEETELRFSRVEKIVEWCNKNIRPFTFIKHIYDVNLIDLNYANEPAVYLVGLYIDKINNNLHDKIVIPYEQENDGHGSNERQPDFGKVRTSGSTKAKKRFLDQAKRGEINFMLLDMNYHQGYAFKEMPEDLLKLTRSCDEPESHTRECGVCFKCSKRKFFKQKIEKNESLTEIWDYVQKKSNRKNNKWLSMKSWLATEVSTYRYFISAVDRIPEKIERDKPEWPTSHRIS
jgi:7-cyano-7-deazaguanine synthase in queuosine biosynthesis